MNNLKELAGKVFDRLSALTDDGRLATKVLYETVENDLNEIQFRTLVSHLINAGVFAGFGSKRGRGGGLFVEDRSKVDKACLDGVTEQDLQLLLNPEKKPKVKRERAPDDLEDEEDTTVGACVYLTKSLRIRALDSRNWGFQKKVGELWMTKGYYSSLANALEIVAKKLVDDRLKNVSAKSMTALAVDIRTVDAEVRAMLTQAFADQATLQTKEADSSDEETDEETDEEVQAVA